MLGNPQSDSNSVFSDLIRSILLEGKSKRAYPHSITAVSAAAIMLPSSSSPTSSISSSDTDVVVMETAKADPLDLTCNSTAANANQPLRRTTANSPSSIETHSNANGPIQSTTTVRGVMSAPMAVTGAAVQPAASSNSTNEEAHRCDMCGKTFAVPARLTRHYRTHTGKTSRTFISIQFIILELLFNVWMKVNARLCAKCAASRFQSKRI